MDMLDDGCDGKGDFTNDNGDVMSRTGERGRESLESCCWDELDGVGRVESSLTRLFVMAGGV